VDNEQRDFSDGKINTPSDCPRLHEIAKQTVAVAKILEVNARTLDSLVEFHKLFVADDASGRMD